MSIEGSEYDLVDDEAMPMHHEATYVRKSLSVKVEINGEVRFEAHTAFNCPEDNDASAVETEVARKVLKDLDEMLENRDPNARPKFEWPEDA